MLWGVFFFFSFFLFSKYCNRNQITKPLLRIDSSKIESWTGWIVTCLAGCDWSVKKKSVRDYTERVIASQCINLSLPNPMHIWECYGMKNHQHWCTEMRKKVIWSDEASFTIFSTSASRSRFIHGACPENNTALTSWMLEKVKVSGISDVL